MLSLSFQYIIMFMIALIFMGYLIIRGVVKIIKKVDKEYIKEVVELIETQDEAGKKDLFKILGIDTKYDERIYKKQAYLYGSLSLIFASLGFFYLITIVISAYNYFKGFDEVLGLVISFSIPFLKNLPIALIYFFGAIVFFYLVIRSIRNYHYAKQRN